MIALTVALAVLVGVTLGLLGGGGSILTVPLLAYVAGMDAKEAIATSLLVVGVTSAVGAISHARAGRVQWRTGILFGLAGMVGAYAGGLLSRFVPGSILLLAFAAMMIATAIAMLRGRKNKTAASDGTHSMPVGKILLDGQPLGRVERLTRLDGVQCGGRIVGISSEWVRWQTGRQLITHDSTVRSPTGSAPAVTPWTSRGPSCTRADARVCRSR